MKHTEDATMILNDMANHGITGCDELVPSRYAVRVGEIEVPVDPDATEVKRLAWEGLAWFVIPAG